MPVRFMNRTMKKIVVRIGRNRLPSFLPSRSSAMFTRTKSRPISTRLWNRPGTSFMRRVPSQKTIRSGDDRDEADQHDAVDLEGGALEEERGGEELVDRRTVEATIVG